MHSQILYDPLLMRPILTGRSVSKLAEMTALGLGLPAQHFSDAGRYGSVQPWTP